MEREQCCASVVGWIIFLAFFFPIHIALKGNDTLQKAAGGKQGSSWYLRLSFIPHWSMSMHCHQMLILFFKSGGSCIVTNGCRVQSGAVHVQCLCDIVDRWY
jgi:hypothetical protein